MDLTFPITATILGMTMVFLTLGILTMVTSMIGRILRDRGSPLKTEYGDLLEDQAFRSSKEDIAIIAAFDDWSTQSGSDVKYGNEYTAYLNEKPYLITLLGKEDGEILAEVSGRRYNLNLEFAEEDREKDTNETESESKGTKQAVKAPLPGEVRNILVKKGARIEVGQNLLTLEALKMENEINSDMAGIVTDVMVSKGDKVEDGQNLLIIEIG